MRSIVAYVPVLHEGYLRFFKKHGKDSELFVFGLEIVAEFPWLAKEIRQIDPAIMQKAIDSLGIFTRVLILDPAQAHSLNTSGNEVILPDEDISSEIAQKYFPDAHLTFDRIFLRWDKHNSIAEKPIMSDRRITREEFHRDIMSEAKAEAAKSSDIWRHVGAVIVKDGETILIVHNRHFPSPHTPYINGDPRNNFHKGDHIEISSGFHAEASLISEAARRGISLGGTDMYVTTFPCPPCARIIAHSGIKTLYYSGGYGVLDGEDILKTAGVEIIFVE